MTNDFTLPPPPPTLRQPIWFAVLVSVGIHGAIAIGWPLLAALSKTPDFGPEKSVNLVELTPAEQKRLPNLSASPFKIPSLSGQPYNLLPSLPPPLESSSLELPKLPSVDNSSSIYNIPPLPYSSSLPDLSNLPALPPIPEYSASSQLPSISTEETRLPSFSQENFSGLESPPVGNWPPVQTPLLRSDWGSLPSSPVTPPVRQQPNTLPGGVLPGLSIEDQLPPPDRLDDPGLISGDPRLQPLPKSGATSLREPPISPNSNQPPITLIPEKSPTPPIEAKPPTPPIEAKPPILPPNGDKPKKSPSQETLVSTRQLPENTPPPAPATQPQNVPPQPNNDSVKQECSNLADPNRTRLKRDQCQNIGSANTSGGANSERSQPTTTTSAPNNPPISPDGPISPENELQEKAVLAYTSWVNSLQPNYSNLETTKPQTIATPYPKATDSQQEASTLVGVLVGARGEILAAQPLMSTGNDALNQAAVEAAKNQKFSSSESGKIKAYQFIVQFKPQSQLPNTATTEQQPVTPPTQQPVAPTTQQPAETIQKPATPPTQQPVAPATQQPAETIQKPATSPTQQPVAPTEQQSPTPKTEQPDATSSAETTQEAL